MFEPLKPWEMSSSKLPREYCREYCHPFLGRNPFSPIFGGNPFLEPYEVYEEELAKEKDFAKEEQDRAQALLELGRYVEPKVTYKKSKEKKECKPIEKHFACHPLLSYNAVALVCNSNPKEIMEKALLWNPKNLMPEEFGCIGFGNIQEAVSNVYNYNLRKKLYTTAYASCSRIFLSDSGIKDRRSQVYLNNMGLDVKSAPIRRQKPYGKIPSAYAFQNLCYNLWK